MTLLYGIFAHIIFIDLICKVKSIIKTNDDRGKHVRGCYDYQMTITLGDLFFGGICQVIFWGNSGYHYANLYTT